MKDKRIDWEFIIIASVIMFGLMGVVAILIKSIEEGSTNKNQVTIVSNTTTGTIKPKTLSYGKTIVLGPPPKYVDFLVDIRKDDMTIAVDLSSEVQRGIAQSLVKSGWKVFSVVTDITDPLGGNRYYLRIDTPETYVDDGFSLCDPKPYSASIVDVVSSQVVYLFDTPSDSNCQDLISEINLTPRPIIE